VFLLPRRPRDLHRNRSLPGQRSSTRPRPTCTPGMEVLGDRTLLTAGWAAALGTSGATSAHGVAFDPGGSSVYVVGSQLSKYTTGGQLLWSQGLGGSSASAWSVAIDSSGDAVVSGTFTGSIVLGTATLTSAGGNDAFVAKFDPSGNVLWARSFGGPGYDQATGLALDGSGAAYVTGRFSNSVAFDSTHTLTSAGSTDAFVLELDASGNVVYATQAGGAGADIGIGLAVDGGGQAYVTGYFAGTASFGPNNLTAPGAYAAYVAQVDANGNFTWARSMGSTAATDPSYAQAQGVALDGSGHVFATGTFTGTTAFGDTTDGSGATSLTAQGKTDAFVTSLDASTGHFLWTEQIGGASSQAHGYGLALDVVGNVYTTGAFAGQNLGIDADPGPGSALLAIQSSNLFQDGYVSELSPTGNFLGAWQMGTTGSSTTTPSGIAVGADGSVYTAGIFTFATRIDTGTQYATLTSAQRDGFVSRMTPGQCVLLGQVFSDPNRNGIRNAGESALAGVTVYLDLNHNGKRDSGEPSTTTNALGGFSFYHLAAGSYTVRETVPSGYTLTTPTSVNVSLTSGQFNDSTSFGNYKPSTLSAIAVKSVPAVAITPNSGAAPIPTGISSPKVVNASVAWKMTNRGQRLVTALKSHAKNQNLTLLGPQVAKLSPGAI
jgi:SdrD B-like domain/Beta-propeller repeat